MNLKQGGEVISGINGQLKHPFDPPSTIRTIPERTSRGLIKGKWYKGNRSNMIVLERQALPDHENKTPRTWAIFTAVIAGDGKTATGQLVNHGGNYGTMFMVKREALAHGTADDVVHHENSLRYHEACRKKSVETQLLLVKNGKHGPGKLDGKPSIRMASEEYVDSMLKWIEVTLKSQP